MGMKLTHKSQIGGANVGTFTYIYPQCKSQRKSINKIEMMERTDLVCASWT